MAKTFYYGSNDDACILDTSGNIQKLYIMREKGYCCGCCDFYDCMECKNKNKKAVLREHIGFISNNDNIIEVSRSAICAKFKLSQKYFSGAMVGKDFTVTSKTDNHTIPDKYKFSTIWEYMCGAIEICKNEVQKYNRMYVEMNKARMMCVMEKQECDRKIEENKQFLDFIESIYGKDVMKKLRADFKKEKEMLQND